MGYLYGDYDLCLSISLSVPSSYFKSKLQVNTSGVVTSSVG